MLRAVKDKGILIRELIQFQTNIDPLKNTTFRSEIN
jgi:hypothetical protein